MLYSSCATVSMDTSSSSEALLDREETSQQFSETLKRSIELCLHVATLSVYCALSMHLPPGAAQDQPPKFPNIGYLGGGYNIFIGNPHSTQGLDPGFTGLL